MPEGRHIIAIWLITMQWFQVNQDHVFYS